MVFEGIRVLALLSWHNATVTLAPTLRVKHNTLYGTISTSFRGILQERPNNRHFTIPTSNNRISSMWCPLWGVRRLLWLPLRVFERLGAKDRRFAPRFRSHDPLASLARLVPASQTLQCDDLVLLVKKPSSQGVHGSPSEENVPRRQFTSCWRVSLKC